MLHIHNPCSDLVADKKSKHLKSKVIALGILVLDVGPQRNPELQHIQLLQSPNTSRIALGSSRAYLHDNSTYWTSTTT